MGAGAERRVARKRHPRVGIHRKGGERQPSGSKPTKGIVQGHRQMAKKGEERSDNTAVWQIRILLRDHGDL